MKKILLAILITTLVIAPVTYAAYDIQSNLKWSRDIVRIDGDCGDNSTATTGESCMRVSVFEEKGNRCYVAFNTTHNRSGGDIQPAISCVKAN